MHTKPGGGFQFTAHAKWGRQTPRPWTPASRIPLFFLLRRALWGEEEEGRCQGLPGTFEHRSPLQVQ